MRLFRRKKIRIIGVAGGVGSGKSTLVREWIRCGARAVDVDRLATRLVAKDAGLKRGLIRSFGSSIFNRGLLQRRELARIVFSDPERLAQLNSLYKRRLKKALKKEIRRLKSRPGGPIVVDMAILLESGLSSWFDLVVVVTAPKKKKVQWLMHDRGWTRSEIEKRMQSQFTEEASVRKADLVVENDSTIPALKKKARELYKQIHSNRIQSS